ncbi:MAG: fumarylacetoacetate hydrolase family protein [Candidatus Bathyarchaeota archaeon]|nr:fumarylacetoacetate hydrolase family protein [Candidatus Bathyarchaeota archaeon]
MASIDSVLTLNTGDVVTCCTNHEGPGILQDGEVVEMEIEMIGRMTLNVSDPLKWVWERGVYMGVDFTNPEGVKKNRPRDN